MASFTCSLATLRPSSGVIGRPGNRHWSLCPPEILMRILVLSGPPTVVKAARVNKHWAEVALGILYTHTNGRVFRALGRMTLETSGIDKGWVFKEAPSPLAWCLFYANRHRVRELDMRAAGGEAKISERAMGAVAQTRPEMIIFPYLRRLRSSARQLTPLFMTSSVVDLCVDMEAADPSTDMSNIRTMVDRICLYLPRLQVLRIDSGPRFHRCEENLIRLFDSLTCLRTVVLPGHVLTPELLCSLSQLPELLELRVASPSRQSIILGHAHEASTLDFDEVTFFRGTFRKLRRFMSSFLSIASSIRTLSHDEFPATTLTYLSIEFAYGGGVRWSSLKEFMDVVAPRFHALEALRIRFMELLLLSGGSTAGQERCPGFDDISGFLSIPTLTSFIVDHPCPIEMTEHDAYTVATNGRRFTEIWLSPRPRWTTVCALLPLSALIPFAIYCPRLRRLGLCIDCSLPVEIPPTDAKFARLAEFYVGESLVSAQRRRMYGEWITVARYLARILTYDCKVVASTGGAVKDPSSQNLGGWRHEEYPYLADAWTTIAGLVGVIQDTRVRMAAE